jgi:hypothetical protein
MVFAMRLKSVQHRACIMQLETRLAKVSLQQHVGSSSSFLPLS